MSLPPKVKIALYARVSTLLGQDPENQLVHLRSFAEGRSCEVFKEYVDAGVSGVRESRPGLDQMVRDARVGRFKLIAVAGIDRLGRSTRHILNLIHELSGYGVSLVSLRESIDFSTPTGQATLTILAAIAALERELLRERIRAALAAKKLAASRTGWRCGRPPKLTPPIITEVRKFRAAGCSLRSIARRLGIAKSTVQRALGQPACPGTIVAANGETPVLPARVNGLFEGRQRNGSGT